MPASRNSANASPPFAFCDIGYFIRTDESDWLGKALHSDIRRVPTSQEIAVYLPVLASGYISVGQTLHLNDPGSEDFRALA